MDIAELLITYRADISSVRSQIGSMKSDLLSVGVAAIALGVQSVKMAGDWQASMTRLYTSAGEAKGNLSMVSSGLLKMAVDVGTSTDQMAKGMYYVESAGFHGAQGLQVMKMAAMGAKAENADLGVVANAVTSALNAYGLKADSAASVTNTLVAAVGHGKMTMSDLSSAVSNVLPATSKFHISLIDTTAAIATMTMQGDNASSAATHLRQMILALESPAKAGASALKEIGLSSQQVSDSMKKSLPDTIKMITDDLGKKFPEGSTAYNTALKNIAGGSKQLLGLLETSGAGLTLFKNNVKDMTAQVKAGGNSIMGWSDIQNTFNFKIDQAKAAIQTLGIKIGTFLLPIAGKLLDTFTGAAQGIQQFGTNMNVLIPVLAGIGAIIAVVLVPAVWSLAAGVIAATWPFVAIGLAVGGLVAIFMHFYQTNAGFKSFIDNIVNAMRALWSMIVANLQPAFAAIGNFMQSVVLPMLQRVGAYLVSTFKPVWDQLVATFRGQILPVWNDLVKAITPLLPALKMAAEGIGMILGAALVIAIAIIGGLIHAFASLLSGIVVIFGGVVEVISGAVKVVAGVTAFLSDLLTGNWSKLGADLGTIMDGIGTMFHGAWQIVIGIFQGGIGAVVGFVAGFGQTIVGIIQGLSDTLVGHSIIPDMINGIVNWFAQLPGRVMAWVSSMAMQAYNRFMWFKEIAGQAISILVSNVVSTVSGLPGKVGGLLQNMASTALGILTGLASSAWTAGSNIVSSIASGITAGIGAVGNAIGAVTSFIAAHLPQSPAKLGPLRDLPKMGANITKQIGEGMLSARPSLQMQMANVVQPYPIRPSASSIAAAVHASSGGASGSGDHTTIIEMDGQEMMEYVQKLTEQKVKLKLSPGRRAGRVA